MLDKIFRICNNVKKLNRDQLLNKTFKNKGVQQQVIDLNQAQMFEEGVDAKGESLGKYSPFTIAIKEKKGQRTDHITLKDTGAFYDSMQVEAKPDAIIIKADMKKPDTDLEVIYPNALGLNEKSLSEIRDFVKPIFIEDVRKAIFA